MFFKDPMMGINMFFYKQWAFHKNSWRKVLVLSLTTGLNLFQIIDLLVANISAEKKIRDAFVCTLWFNAVLRGWVFYFKKESFVYFMDEIVNFSNDINYRYNDVGVIKILQETTHRAKRWNLFNLAVGISTCIGFSCRPLVADIKELPYGVYVPFVDKLQTPYYETIYVLMVIITPIACHIYIPLSNLFVIFMMFGTTMCQILQFRLKSLHLREESEKILMDQIVWCIIYQRKLIKYVGKFNILISILFLTEFAMYGIILCALLFLMATMNDVVNAVIIFVYFITMFSQISAFAWFANELYDESLGVANAAYGCKWYNYTKKVKMTLLMLILRAQRPLAIRMGTIYDMNLQSLQSLLNVTYTTFTLLKRLYRQR